MKSLSPVWLFATPWTVANQAPPSMGFSRQEYWSGLPFPSPGDLLTQGLNLGLLHCRQTLYCLSHQGSHNIYIYIYIYIYTYLCQVSVASHGISSCATRTFQLWFSSCGLRRTCLAAHGILVPPSGIELVSPALQARFLTSGPPGKPSKMLHTLTLVSHYLEIEKIIQHDGKALSLKVDSTAVATVWEMVTSLKVQVRGHSYGKSPLWWKYQPCEG